MNAISLLPPLLGLAAAPLFSGLIAKLKARAVGRQGPPLLQRYRAEKRARAPAAEP